MRRIVTVDALSRRSPTIVAVTLGIALLAYWFGAPLVVPYGLALIVGGIAIVVMAARKRNARLNAELEAAKTGSWIAQELAGHGSPPGSYTLAFFCLVTIALTGFVGPFALPAWTGLALAAAWAFANASYPSDEV